MDALLTRALTERNRLAHGFFRHHAETGRTPAGRAAMIDELARSRKLFIEADRALEEAVRPLRDAAGVSDEMITEALQMASAER